ncbi:MAG TPA: hypothetical protein VJ508_03045 [Saprospiraceae bacterium]|nr:hypothetical protein [Saprospiraceae bacterium]
MSLTSLTSLTQEQYQALNKVALNPAPTITTTGTPDNKISVALDGFVGGQVMAIRITSAGNTSAALGISDSSKNETNITVSAGVNPNNTETYWTVDMGAGAGASDWSISFSTTSGGRNTGKWTFAKGKTQRPRN